MAVGEQTDGRRARLIAAFIIVGLVLIAGAVLALQADEGDARLVEVPCWTLPPDESLGTEGKCYRVHGELERGDLDRLICDQAPAAAGCEED
jgi:hypothetical protein